MLVLKRKEGKSLVIMIAGKTVKVTMLKCSQNAVSVGISADDDVHIVRSELLATGNDKEAK